MYRVTSEVSMSFREKVDFFQGERSTLLWFYFIFSSGSGENQGRMFNGSNYCIPGVANRVAQVKEFTTRLSEGTQIFSLMQLEGGCSLLLAGYSKVCGKGCDFFDRRQR